MKDGTTNRDLNIGETATSTPTNDLADGKDMRINAEWERRMAAVDEYIEGLTSSDTNHAPSDKPKKSEGDIAQPKGGDKDSATESCVEAVEQSTSKPKNFVQEFYLREYTKCQQGNPHPDMPLPQVEDMKSCPKECQGPSGWWLWDHELIRMQGDAEMIGYVSIFYLVSFQHDENGHGDPRLAVILTDQSMHGRGRLNDISDTPVGQLIIAGWKVLCPEVYSSLPKTHAEWVELNRVQWRERMVAEIEEAGVPTGGYSDTELVKLHEDVQYQQELDALRKDGWSEEIIQAKLRHRYPIRTVQVK